ncbi:MAG: PAS domain S-box protein [Daejeonella sp.]|uniref:PAS domain S-box protein n=1 Tax=Daejeonella sp. TaxID=2805397 RepID=UPI0027332E11|nr:PAS domain S-box protein [Daejeonella sp.]MDP3467318.1 PAS domain S-box protein [Daejeonella sp.]
MNIPGRYISLVKRNCTNPGDKEHDLVFWRNKLFATTIIYLLPLSLIAILPGFYWIYKINRYAIGVVDLLAVCGIVVVGFVPGISLINRKIIFISCAYIFSFAFLYYVDLNGPGLIYLYTSSLFSILIFSTTNIFWSAWMNTFLCAFLALLIGLGLMPVEDDRSHNIAEWIAVSTNLIFLSFLCSALIPRLFHGLQRTISKAVQLKNELETQSHILYDTSNALRDSLNDTNKLMDSSRDVICAVDVEGRFVKVSAASKRVWGYAPEELVGKKIFDMVYEEDRVKTIKSAEIVMAGINLTNFENRYIHKDGSIVPISWSVRWDPIDRVRYGVARDISEIKKLEKDIETQKKHLYDLFLQSPVSMGVLRGANHVYEVANPLYLELIQKTDIIGKTVQEVLPEVVDQGFLDILDSVYKTGESFSANEMLIRLEEDGNVSEKYLNFSYQAHRNTNLEIDGIFFFAVDVTEQVLSRKRIETSELRLKEAQAIALMGNWEIDLEHNVHFWSDEVYKILGICPGDLTPGEESFKAFVHPEDLEYGDYLLNKGFETNENMSFYFRIIRKDGSIKHCYNEWKFKFDESGNPIFISGILQDVTERKEAERQLEDSEAFSRGVLNSLASNIAVIDFSGNIIAVNESWDAFALDNGAQSLQKTGIGSNYFEVCGKAQKHGLGYADEAYKGINDVLEDKRKVFYMEYPCHSSQENRWFGMRVKKFEGNQSLLVLSHQDISELKSAEFKLTKLAADLTSRNKDLEQFTYIISHNLRAPVANILGLASLWDEPRLTKTENGELNRALLESVHNLDTIVKDLNQILQIRGAIIEYNEQIQFSGLVEDIKISIKNLIDSDGVDIKYDFSEINIFSSLKSYMYSIFYNLISNSIKYRQNGVPCLIKIESHLTGNKLELIFSDNGLGIDLEKKGEQVFGLYKRFHSHVEGKGLGLFMVKTQVEKLGGKIRVQSEVNKGTSFKIEFEI